MTPANLELPASETKGLTRPLDYFYTRAGLALPPYQVLLPAEVPRPFQQLLVHENDMTPTLEEFYGDEIELRVLSRRRRGQEYWREVVLLLRGTGQPVEFGANRVLLNRFPEAAREAILEEGAPLGHIMRDYRVAHKCQPNAFMGMQADALMGTTLQLPGGSQVYGRHNRLYRLDGLLLSEVVEILRPPVI